MYFFYFVWKAFLKLFPRRWQYDILGNMNKLFETVCVEIWVTRVPCFRNMYTSRILFKSSGSLEQVLLPRTFSHPDDDRTSSMQCELLHDLLEKSWDLLWTMPNRSDSPSTIDMSLFVVHVSRLDASDVPHLVQSWGKDFFSSIKHLRTSSKLLSFECITAGHMNEDFHGRSFC